MNATTKPGAPLTPREVEVLRLVADGLGNQEIARALWLSLESVKTHVRHVLTKLGARNRAHAVAIGYQRGLLDHRHGTVTVEAA